MFHPSFSLFIKWWFRRELNPASQGWKPCILTTWPRGQLSLIFHKPFVFQFSGISFLILEFLSMSRTMFIQKFPSAYSFYRFYRIHRHFHDITSIFNRNGNHLCLATDTFELVMIESVLLPSICNTFTWKQIVNTSTLTNYLGVIIRFHFVPSWLKYCLLFILIL